MRINFTFLLIATLLVSCTAKPNKQVTDQGFIPITGTWKLLSETTIQKGDTAFTDHTKDEEALKIINGSHFSFLRHDLNKGKDSSRVFVAGGGRYTLAGNEYTEMLDYCSDREWESNSFNFTVAIQNDTLIQSGIEKVDGIGVDRKTIEKYVRLNP